MSDCFQKRLPSGGLGTRHSMLYLWVENPQVQEMAQTSTVSWLNQHCKPLEPMLMCDLFESSKYIPTAVLDTVTCDNSLWYTKKSSLKILNTVRKIIVPITAFSWLLPVTPFTHSFKNECIFLTDYRWKNESQRTWTNLFKVAQEYDLKPGPLHQKHFHYITSFSGMAHSHIWPLQENYLYGRKEEWEWGKKAVKERRKIRK